MQEASGRTASLSREFKDVQKETPDKWDVDVHQTCSEEGACISEAITSEKHFTAEFEK